MKKMIRRLLSLCILLSTGTIMAECCSSSTSSCNDLCGGGNPTVSFRSHSTNTSREQVGWQTKINRYFKCEEGATYGAFSITPEYTRSMYPSQIAGFLFGQDYYKEGKLVISGTAKGTDGDYNGTLAGLEARDDHEWLADYFGLPTNFVSNVHFTPRISNYLLDLNFYIGLDEVSEGVFFKVHAPIVHTRWRLNPCEEVLVKGENGYASGYMNTSDTGQPIARAELPANWLAAMQGVTWGDMQEALKYGKISESTLAKTRLSEIQMALGWNFIQGDDYHFGLMVRGAIPTGNKSTAEYLFEPIVGNGKHWELGVGLTGHARLWTGCDENNWLDVYADANVTHLFKKKMWRSFDLKDKPNSRYMLISEMTSTVNGLYTADDDRTTPTADSAPKYQYTGKLFPLINKSTCCTDISIAMQVDAAITLAYTHKNDCGTWEVDLGYNMWGRTGEKFNRDCCTDTCCLEKNKYALKGDAYVAGWGVNNTAASSKLTRLSVSESKATINAGTIWKNGTTEANMDNMQVAYTAANGVTEVIRKYNVTYRHELLLHTSKDPILLSCDDLNMCNTPRALSHKIFFHFNYIWDNAEESDCGDWTPFIGLGGEFEFAGKNTYGYSALSQWGAWIKGGFAFE